MLLDNEGDQMVQRNNILYIRGHTQYFKVGKFFSVEKQNLYSLVSLFLSQCSKYLLHLYTYTLATCSHLNVA